MTIMKMRSLSAWVQKLPDEMVNQIDSKLETKFNAMETRMSVSITKIASIVLKLNNRYNTITLWNTIECRRGFENMTGEISSSLKDVRRRQKLSTDCFSAFLN